MNVLNCSENEVKQFWDIVQLPVRLILQTLGESSVPKAVLKPGGECDSIQKSLRILCKKIKFSTTSLFQIKCFKNLQKAITNQRNMNFPLIISVMGTLACYHHVVVIWRGMIIDYESKYTFPFKINQFSSDMLQCSKMTSSHSTLKKIWYFPCRISLMLIWNLVSLPHWINYGSRM
jgi:hypothetical protein